MVKPLKNSKIDTIIIKDSDVRKVVYRVVTDHSQINESTQVFAFIWGTVERIYFDTSNVAILGRFDNQPKLTNKLDLSRYDALKKGVSRVHRQLLLYNNELYVSDLNSSNGTRINDVRLTPDKPYRLERGQIITLGFLSVQIILMST